MVKMENDDFILLKPIFYEIVVDGVCRRMEIGDDILFNQLIIANQTLELL